MGRLSKALFAAECVAVPVLYAAPFFLEKTAKKHMMFYRYLIVKQYWWADKMLFWRLALTLAAAVMVICIIWAIKSMKRPELLLCRMVNIACLAVAAAVMNIRPSSTLVYFLLLIASGAAVILSFLTTIIIKTRKGELNEK